MYIPILKTTDAELRAVKHLASSVKDEILPLFELTKSRRTKNTPHGDIYRRLDKIDESYGDRPFILDLTTLDDLKNPQIESLLEPENGFTNWCRFVEEIENKNVIPVIHAYFDDDGAIDMANEVERLSEQSSRIAFRITINDMSPDETGSCLAAITGAMNPACSLFVVVDVGLIKHVHTALIENAVNNHLNAIFDNSTPEHVFVAGSSFPRNVLDHGEDHAGEVPLEEVIIYQNVRANFPDRVIEYGDYGSVHPIRYEVRGGTWVPRVDVPLAQSIFYHRYRREEGGYPAAAGRVMNDPRYQVVGSWGDDQITLAASNGSTGRSPSFWISVRINIHVTRKATEYGVNPI